MRTLVLSIVWGAVLYAQHITTGLQTQYDMVTTGGGGTTMTDLSGNGHNGTLHGTTQIATGTTFNGSTDFIDTPALTVNGPYTVLVVIGNVGSAGMIWAEISSNGQTYMRMSANGTAQSSANSAVTAPYPPAGSGRDWECITQQRNENMLLWNRIDTGFFSTANLASGSTAATTLGGIGAQNLGSGSSNVNWSGTIAYFELYTVFLTQQQVQQEYAYIQGQVATRGVYMHSVNTQPEYPGRVWNRQGVVLWSGRSDYGGGMIENEHTQYTTADCVIVSNPCFGVLFDSGSNTYYSESTDGRIWVTPVQVLASVMQTSFVKVGSTYHVYGTNGTSTQINHYTGSKLNSLTLANSAVIGLGSAGQFDATHVYGSGVAFNSGTYYIVYSGLGTMAGQTGFMCGGATSPDGVTWTKTGPIHGVNDPVCAQGSLEVIGTAFYWWYANTNTAFYRVSTPLTAFTGLWTFTSPKTFSTASGLANFFSQPTFTSSSIDENVQISDPCPVQANGVTYLFYDANGTGGSLSLKLATGNLTLAQLVQTGEGATADAP